MPYYEIFLLCGVALCAGFVDAIVGGGGLIQTPALLITLPQYPVATLLGTTKIPSFSGTAMATFMYSRNVTFHWRMLGITALAAFTGAWTGSSMVDRIPVSVIKPVMLVLLIGMALYTYFRKDFGQQRHDAAPSPFALYWGLAAGLVIGFYDGLFGPGSGSLWILFFISRMGFDFMQASGHAKTVNLATNLSSMIFFGIHGHILWELTFFMAAANCTGGYLGARLAILKGNRLIRYFFLTVVTATILRFAYDLFVHA